MYVFSIVSVFPFTCIVIFVQVVCNKINTVNKWFPAGTSHRGTWTFQTIDQVLDTYKIDGQTRSQLLHNYHRIKIYLEVLIESAKTTLALQSNLIEFPNQTSTPSWLEMRSWELGCVPLGWCTEWIRVSDTRSVWIMVHQRNWWICDQSGFIGSFDVPWSRQILDPWSWSRSPQRTAP